MNRQVAHEQRPPGRAADGTDGGRHPGRVRLV